MKRLGISISILILFVSFTNDALARQGKSLHQLIIDGEIDQVKSRIEAGEDVNTRNRMNWSLLHTAIWHKKTKIIQLLLDKGADVNLRDNRGRTPLHFAVETGQKDVVEQLISKGAEINVMDGRADNALSLATKNNQKEIADLLKKHGAQEPNPQDLFGDRLYSSPGGPQGPGPNANSAGRTRPGINAGNIGQTSVEADLLADPNEIKTRVKSFKGLEKAVKEVSDKSKNEERHWLQTRYDNRSTLATYVDKQYEDEIGFIRKIAVEESAKKTIKSIDSLRTNRNKRSSEIKKELREQRREQSQTGLIRTRTRGRTTGRNSRGRTSMRGYSTGTNAADDLYGRDSISMPGGYGPENDRRPAEQQDPQTQEEIRLWTQAAPDNKIELARALHPIYQAELSSIRAVAVEEKAKKTTAAIDGVLLARKERFDQIVMKMEEEARKLQEQQSLLNRANDQNQAYQQNSRYGGRTSRRGRGGETDNLQQQNTRRTRGRRR
jgi:hypothetical protein